MVLTLKNFLLIHKSIVISFFYFYNKSIEYKKQGAFYLSNPSNSFDIIFNHAKKKFSENEKIIASLKEKEEYEKMIKKEVEKNKRRGTTSSDNPEIDNCSDELLSLIKQFNFNIESYEKIEFDENQNSWDRELEIYYCSYGDWQFKITHIEDVDITEGIFVVNEILNKETTEKVDFYCDFGCRNTSECRRNEFILFLQYNSLDLYISDKYSHYLELPNLLSQKGYVVEKNDFKFYLNNPKGYLKIDDNLYVKIYSAWWDDLKTVITNDNKWDINSSNDNFSKAYYFEYNSTLDFDELCKCIEAFKEEQQGRIGYYDEEEKVYYSNKDIMNFYNSLRDKDDYYKHCWNNYLIEIKHEDHWDKKGYEEENSRIINKYKGLEIYLKTKLTFNGDDRMNPEFNKNSSYITFEYDKRKSDKCRLLIQYYSFKEDLEDYDYEKQETKISNEKLISSFEHYGSFKDLMYLLESYVNEMIKIHQIEL